jgi:hypothetical protein
VSGIIILITLMLVLELVQRRQSSAQVRTEAIAAQLRKTIDSAEAEVNELKAALANESGHLEKVAGVSVEVMRREAFDTEAEIGSLQAEITELEAQERRATKENERMQAALFDRRKDEEKRAELETSTRDLEAELETITSSDQLIFNPMSPEGKAVWIAQIESGRVLVGRAGQRQKPEVFESGILQGAAVAFRTWLGSRSTANDYFFLLVRPGGAGQFSEIRAALSERSFSVGFDLLDEKQIAIDPEVGATL